MTTRAPAPGSLRELLDKAYDELLRLRRRQYALDAFVQELDRVSRNETFDIHNDVRWFHVLDLRDKNVIDLASWGKGAYSKGGIFGALCAHHLAAFPAARSWKDDAEPQHRADGQDTSYDATRKRLFGNDVGPSLKPDDVHELHAGFRRRFEPLVNDRNENRAHIYERGGTGTAAMLEVSETRALFDYANDIVDGLSLVAHGGNLKPKNMFNASVDDDAQDVVDDILLPRDLRRKLLCADIARDALYATLHDAKHDPLGKPAFNRGSLVQRAMVSLGVGRVVNDD